MMGRRRWVVLAIGCWAVIGCGKGDKKPAEGSGSGAPAASDAAAAAPALDAAEVALDAAVAAGPALPAKAQCTGHWVARTNSEGSKTCDAKILEPLYDLDMVVAAGPTGWTATLAKPAGFELASINVVWDSEGDGHCAADAIFKRGDLEMSISLSHGYMSKPMANMNMHTGHGDSECMSSGVQVDATYTPDAGGLPPIAPHLIGITGSYQLDVAWPKVKCDVQPTAKQSFQIDIDRKSGDALVVSGHAWTVFEPRFDGMPAKVYMALHPPETEEFTVTLKFEVAGDKVTGSAQFGPTEVGEDEDPKCKFIDGVITGTRTAK